LEAGKSPAARSLALGPKHTLSAERKGEIFFNDADLCFQKWQSCASCHPDGRADGLNWDLLNDGPGNPKNTKSLVRSHQTPPAMVTGVRNQAEDAVRAGIRYIQFAVRPEEDAAAIDLYLRSLEPVPSPHLEGNGLSHEAKRGQRIFEQAGCAKCHPHDLYTDLKKYDVGLGKGSEEGLAFDTPTLVEIWRTAPYLYDGRAANMTEMLKNHNSRDQHGSTAVLNEKEIRALAAYVLSL
jgi:cytochrome c peroxidase